MVVDRGVAVDQGHLRVELPRTSRRASTTAPGWVLVLCALDNLVKGASGQAVQCANIALGLPETTGLPHGGGVPVSVTAPARVRGRRAWRAGSRRRARPTWPWWPPPTAGPVAAAGVFTTNLAAAAPVQVSRAHLAATGGRAAAVVLSSGNANAATGAPGVADAERMCALVGDGPRRGRRPRSSCARRG